MDLLKELPWFNTVWSEQVRDATRELVRLYAEAIERVERWPRWFQVVRLSGARASMRSLFVFKPLLRDAVSDHVKRVLQGTIILQVRAFMANRPTAWELKLGINRKHATAEAVAAAEEALAEFTARQQAIAGQLKEAAADVRELLEAIGSSEPVSRRAFQALVRAGRRLLPLLWAGVVISQFSKWSGQSQVQLVLFFIGAAAVYHILAWATLPFHDAGERKYIYFDGYVRGQSDGLDPLHPPASRVEARLFKLLGAKPPIVISWETIVPLLHYALISVLLVVMLIKLPFAGAALRFAVVVTIVLIIFYVRNLALLWLLLRLRYKGASAWEIVLALFSSVSVLAPSDESSEPEGKAEAGAATDTDTTKG